MERSEHGEAFDDSTVSAMVAIIANDVMRHELRMQSCERRRYTFIA